MVNSFDLLNKIFDLLANDKEMCQYLEIDTTKLKGNKLLDKLNDKLRREYQTAEVIERDDVPFISFYFMHAEKTKNNWLVNKGDLYVDIYVSNIYTAGQISKRFRQIIADNLKILLNYEGQHFSGVIGVYKYRLIYNPLIDGE